MNKDKDARALPHDRQADNNTEDPRRIANRIRDSYTLTEAEGVLMEFVEQHVSSEITSELKAIQQFNEAVGSALPWEVGVGAYIEARLQSLKQPQENDT